MYLQNITRSPIDFLSEMNGDNIYFQQAMHQEDSADFIETMVKSINGHVDNYHFKLVTIEDYQEEEEALPSVWAMRRNQNLATNEARINVDGGKQTLGVNFFDTYYPVVT